MPALRFIALATASLLACAPRSPRPAPPQSATGTSAPTVAERLYSQPAHRWVEDAFLRASASPDGRWLLASAAEGVALIDIASGARDEARARRGMDRVDRAFFCGEALAREGARNGIDGLFAEDGHKMDVPAGRQITCADDGARVVAFRAMSDGDGLDVGTWESRKHIAIDGMITAAALARSGDVVYALVWRDSGASSLVAVDAARGSVKTLVDGLDASPLPTTMSASRDGAHLYLSLAGVTPARIEDRSKPLAGRWLDIYAYDLSNGNLRPIVKSAVDKRVLREADGFVVWSQWTMHRQVVAFPASGGPAHLVVDGAEFPSFSPDGGTIGFAFGEWRLADWELSLEGGAMAVDEQLRSAGARVTAITSTHEDIEPEWSPDGAWVAFHSHRAPAPVARCDDPRASDDVWLKRAGDPPSAGIRLSDFGREAGAPSWSPDGKRVVFSSFDVRAKPAGRLYIVTVDPSAGRAVETRELAVPGAGNVLWPAWSRATGTIAFESTDAPGKHALWTVSADGSNAAHVASYANDAYSGVDWSHDGQSLVYAAVADGRMQIFSLPRSGGVPRRISDDPADLLHARVSPDGRWIACTRMEESFEVMRSRVR